VSARVAIVTGGARGIGRAVGLRLAEDGVRVVLADVVPGGDAVAAAITDAGGQAHAVELDVTDAAAVDDRVARVAGELGPPLVLVNCAGVLGPEAALDDVDVDEMRRVLEVNFFGVLHCCRAVVPHMRAAGWGRVVTISSHSRHGCEERAPYAASKAAVTSLMRTLAMENVRTGILANCIEPGRTLTDMIVPRFTAEHLADPPDAPIGRYADPAEIAEAVAWLCSERNTYATGAMFNVSGGAI
jgi:3-oxoacyl-[acyl-carrier protein] reductase